MTVEVRYYDTEGDGFWFKVEPVEKSETETEAVVAVIHSEAEDAAVWLSADDVEKLVEELQKYRKPKATIADPWKPQIYNNYTTNTTMPSAKEHPSAWSDPYPG